MVPLVGIMFGNVIGGLTNYLAYQYEMTQALSTWTVGHFSMVLRGRYELVYLMLGGADFHGVEHQLLAAEVDRHNHVAHRGQQNQQGQQSHLADVCPVGGGGKGCACPVHAASPPSRWAAGAQPQPAPPPVRRIALRPWRRR